MGGRGVAAVMEIRTFTGAGFAENAYLAVCAGSADALVIDPGAAAPEMVVEIERDRLRVHAIVITHGHLDHVEGAALVARSTGAPVALHPADRFLYDGVVDQAVAFGVAVEPPPEPRITLAHGDRLEFGGCALEVRHAPGHSPGHVILYSPADCVAFVADVVFAGSIGRTDLPGGDYRQLMRSIREQVLTLPDDTRLLPGHGPETTVWRERVGNPFLIPHYGGELA